MPGKRIPQLDAIAGASTANDDNLVIYDTDAGTTKRILRSQLAAGLVGDLPYTPAGFIAATTVPTAIAEIASDLAAQGGSSLVGFLQTGTSAVPTNVQAKLRETVSVKDFGAVGDGVTDDTAAIQAAIDAAANNSAVFIPDTGTSYIITSNIVVNKPLVLTSNYAQLKVKDFEKITGTITSVIEVNSSDVIVENLRINCNGINNYYIDGGVKIYKFGPLGLRQASGIRVSPVDNTSFLSNVVIRNNYVTDTDSGISISGKKDDNPLSHANEAGLATKVYVHDNHVDLDRGNAFICIGGVLDCVIRNNKVTRAYYTSYRTYHSCAKVRIVNNVTLNDYAEMPLNIMDREDSTSWATSNARGGGIFVHKGSAGPDNSLDNISVINNFLEYQNTQLVDGTDELFAGILHAGKQIVTSAAVIGNTIKNPPAMGIACRALNGSGDPDRIFSDNTIINAKRDGFLVNLDSGGRVFNNVIKGFDTANTGNFSGIRITTGTALNFVFNANTVSRGASTNTGKLFESNYQGVIEQSFLSENSFASREATSANFSVNLTRNVWLPLSTQIDYADVTNSGNAYDVVALQDQTGVATEVMRFTLAKSRTTALWVISTITRAGTSDLDARINSNVLELTTTHVGGNAGRRVRVSMTRLAP